MDKLSNTVQWLFVQRLGVRLLYPDLCSMAAVGRAGRPFFDTYDDHLQVRQFIIIFTLTGSNEH